MRKLRIALMGCGRISASYALVFPRLSDIAEFVCAIDIEEERAKAFAAPFGAAWGTRFEDLSDKNVDIVHLCLPHYLHAPAAIRAMEAGMHVLTEKPVSITLQDADRMKTVSERTGKKLGVIFQTRYEESVQQLRRMIQDGAFGRILSARSIFTWSRPYSYYEGCDWKAPGTGKAAACLSIRPFTASTGSAICWEARLNGLTAAYTIITMTGSGWKIPPRPQSILKTAASTVFMPQIPMRPMPLFFWNSRAKKAAAG